MEVDEEAVRIKAASAERAFSKALDRLSELIEIAVENKLGPEIGDIARLVKVSLYFEVVLQGLSQLHLDLGKRQGQIGDGVGQIGVVDLFGKFFKRLGALDDMTDSCQGCTNGCRHNRFSVAVAMLEYAKHYDDMGFISPEGVESLSAKLVQEARFLALLARP